MRWSLCLTSTQQLRILGVVATLHIRCCVCVCVNIFHFYTHQSLNASEEEFALFPITTKPVA